MGKGREKEVSMKSLLRSLKKCSELYRAGESEDLEEIFGGHVPRNFVDGLGAEKCVGYMRKIFAAIVRMYEDRKDEERGAAFCIFALFFYYSAQFRAGQAVSREVAQIELQHSTFYRLSACSRNAPSHALLKELLVRRAIALLIPRSLVSHSRSRAISEAKKALASLLEPAKEELEAARAREGYESEKRSYAALASFLE